MRPLLRNLTPFVACCALAALSSCLPPGESGQCLVDEDCTGRGQECDVDNSLCVDIPFDASSTETPAPGSFADKVVPFFRGQVCTIPEVRSGSTFPVTMTPCVHPCMTVKNFKFKHFFECTGSTCNAWALMWMVADGTACPADAFGEFDQSMCQWVTPVDMGTKPVSFAVDTTLDTGPIVGTMLFEIPFVTNADMAALAPTGAENPDVSAIKDRIFQYAQDPSRVLNNGLPLSLLDSHPTPPESCDGNACTCYNIGF